MFFENCNFYSSMLIYIPNLIHPYQLKPFNFPNQSIRNVFCFQNDSLISRIKFQITHSKSCPFFFIHFDPLDSIRTGEIFRIMGQSDFSPGSTSGITCFYYRSQVLLRTALQQFQTKIRSLIKHHIPINRISRLSPIHQPIVRPSVPLLKVNITRKTRLMGW